jgi:hypothetical protein
MARANDTQIGLSWETVPSSETAVPPRRTASVRRRKHSRRPSVRKKSSVPPQIGGRPAVEEGGGVGGELVAVDLLAEEAEDGEVVRQDAHAPRRGPAGVGELRRRPLPGGHLREQVELDGRPERLGALEGVDGVEEQRG